MFTPFKSRYEQDYSLFQSPWSKRSYAILSLILVSAPLWADDYLLYQFSLVFILGLGALGLTILTGMAGQVSLGHGALFGVGAYAAALGQAGGYPLVFALPVTGLAAMGVMLLLAPTILRLKGLYLAMGTLALGFLIEEVLVEWEAVTEGSMGLFLFSPTVGNHVLDTESRFYWLCLVVTVPVTWAVVNLSRSPTGKAWMALRESEQAAAAMGIHRGWTKVSAFAASAFITGIAGALYAYRLQTLYPDSFGFALSIDLIVIIVIGGLGSIRGAYLGAAFMVMVRELLALYKDLLPADVGYNAGLEPMFFAATVLLVLYLEPGGLNGLWLKLRQYLGAFPFHKAGSLKAGTSHQKTARW